MTLRTNFFTREVGREIVNTLLLKVLSYLTQPEDMAHAMMVCRVFNQVARQANLHYVPNGFSCSQPFKFIPIPELDFNVGDLSIISLNESIVLFIPGGLSQHVRTAKQPIIVANTNKFEVKRISFSNEVLTNVIKLDAEHFIVVSDNHSIDSLLDQEQKEITFELWHVNHIGSNLIVTLKASQQFSSPLAYREATGAFFDENTIVFTQSRGPVTQWNIATNRLRPFAILDKPYEPGCFLAGPPRSQWEGIKKTLRESKQVRFIVPLDKHRIAICFAVTIKIWDKRINNFTHSGDMKISPLQIMLPISSKYNKKHFTVFLMDENHLLNYDFNFLLLWNFNSRLNTVMTQVTKIEISSEGCITDIYRISPSRIVVLARVDADESLPNRSFKRRGIFVFHYQDGKLRLQAKLIDTTVDDVMRYYTFHVLGDKLAVRAGRVNYLNIYDLNDPALSFERPPAQQLAYVDGKKMNMPHGFLAQRKTHQWVAVDRVSGGMTFWRPNPLKVRDQIRDQQGRVTPTSASSSSTATFRSLSSS